MIANTDASRVQMRLLEAAQAGERLELILVLRGRVRLVHGKTGDEWSIRVDGQRPIRFSADAVVAATPWRGPPPKHPSAGVTR